MANTADKNSHGTATTDLGVQCVTTARKDAPPWDAINKAAFKHSEVLRDFLRLYVHEDFVKDLDLSSPEPLPSEFVTEAMRKRYNDYIRKIRWKGTDAYLLLILEFQSSTDTWMPVRILAYTALLWLDLIEKKLVSVETKLPPVFPIILYRGTEKWEGPLDIEHLLSPAAMRMVKYQPSNLTLLVREELFKNDLLNKNSDLYALFLLIRRAKNVNDFRTLIKKYRSILKNTEYKELLRTFLSIMNTMQTYFNPNSSSKVEFSSLEEVEEMFQSYAEQFKENTIKSELPIWKEDALKEQMPIWKEDALKEQMPIWKEDALKEQMPIWKEDVLKEQMPIWKEKFIREHESIWAQEYKNQLKCDAILSSIKGFLDARFGQVSQNYDLSLRSIRNVEKLNSFSNEVYKVNNIGEFEHLLDKYCSL